MAVSIYRKKTAYTEVTITLASLAAAAARQSALIDTSNYGALRVFWEIKSGTAPTAGGLYELYIVHFDLTASPQVGSMGADGTDSAFSGTLSEDPIALITVTNTANAIFSGPSRYIHGLGPATGFIVKNNTSQALNATEADSKLGVTLFYDEVQ